MQAAVVWAFSLDGNMTFFLAFFWANPLNSLSISCGQVFEVEDADGPLEGAAQDNIAARFGRLKVGCG